MRQKERKKKMASLCGLTLGSPNCAPEKAKAENLED